MSAATAPASSNVQRACAVIREAVESGRFGGGDRVREAVVAEMAGVSRTSVRQALTLLAAEGFVELRPNRGAIVVALSDANLLQVIELRALLESYAAGLAARHADAQAVAAMRAEAQVFAQIVASSAWPEARGLAESNDRLHRLLLDAAGNPRLTFMLTSLVQMPFHRQTFGRYDRAALERSAQQHMDVVEAVARGDAAWAEATMSAHIHASRQAVANPAAALATRGRAGAEPTPVHAG